MQKTVLKQNNNILRLFWQMWPYKQFGGLCKFHAYAYFYSPGCEKKMNYIIISLTHHEHVVIKSQAMWNISCCKKVCSLCQNISHCEKGHYYHMTVDAT